MNKITNESAAEKNELKKERNDKQALKEARQRQEKQKKIPNNK